MNTVVRCVPQANLHPKNSGAVQNSDSVSQLNATMMNNNDNDPALEADRLQEEFLNQLAMLQAPRLGIIELPLLSSTNILPTDDLSSRPVITQNICQVMTDPRLKRSHVYFSPKYNSNDGASLLLRDIKVAAISGGDKLVSNGKGTERKKRTQVFYLRCSCSIVYRHSKLNMETGQTQELSYRQNSFINDRRNNRPNGESLPRKTTTSLATDCNRRCPFSLSIYKDKVGFYFVAGTGNMNHCFHEHCDYLRLDSSLLTEDDIQSITNIKCAKAPLGVAVNTHFIRTSRTGCPTILSKHQICHLVHLQPHSDNGKSSSSDSLDDLFLFFSEKKASYVSLIQQMSTEGPLVYNKVCDGINPIQKLPVESPEDVELFQLMAEHRRQRNLRPDQEMMVGVAFALPYEINRFKAFHIVMHIDATSSTNNENQPLLTITSKDNNGKMFNVIRAFLPSEQAWAFKWFFFVAMPLILGKELLQSVKIIITDGDSQEIQQLDEAMTHLFSKETRRVCCTWHIVDCGWARNLPDIKLGGHSKKKRPPHLVGRKRKPLPPLTEPQVLARVLYRWIYTWALPRYCESQEEFELSKALFLFVVRSELFTSTFGTSLCQRMIEFVRRHVFPNQSCMCYYLRRSFFHLETHTNCSHEGTNKGMKYSACPVRPQLSIDKSAQILTLNAEISDKNNQIQNCSQATSFKLWSISPTAPFLTELAESLVMKQWEERVHFVYWKLNERQWLVTSWKDSILYLDESYQTENDFSDDLYRDTEAEQVNSKKFDFIPRFERVHQVSVEPDTSIMRCSCSLHDRMGIPCSHMAAVLKQPNHQGIVIDEQMPGFPCPSVRVLLVDCLLAICRIKQPGASGDKRKSY